MSERSGAERSIFRRCASWMPGLVVLADYRRSQFPRDALAGATVAAYMVPQVMAYSGVAGLSPVTGLWATLPALLIYALLGSSRLVSIGPESTTALMTATVVGPLAAGSPSRYAALVAALAIVVGLMSILAAVTRLGFVSDLLSRPVLTGYLAGVALLVIVDQLPKLTGVPISGADFLPQLVSFVRHLSAAEAATLALAAATLIFLFVVARFFPAVPGPLLAAILGTAVVAAFGLDGHGIDVIGAVPAGLPRPELPALSQLPQLLLPALSLLLVGYTDVMATARAFAARGGDKQPAPNRELFALGVANLGAGTVQGFPVSGSASRTALAYSAGARTRVYSLITFGLVIVVVLFLGPLLAHMPTAVLGAIVVYAVTRLIDISGFRRLAGFRRRELFLALGCLVGVLALNILYGVLVAVGLSIAELLVRVARPHDAIQGLVPGLAGMHDVNDYPQARIIPGLLIYRYDSPLFFANAEDFRRRALAAVEDQPKAVRWFVLNAEANVEVDITALDAVDFLRRELVDRGIVFALARVKQDLRESLDAYGLTDSVGAEFIFPTLPTAVAAYHDWCRGTGSRS